jgi:hypothetical protein
MMGHLAADGAPITPHRCLAARDTHIVHTRPSLRAPVLAGLEKVVFAPRL